MKIQKEIFLRENYTIFLLTSERMTLKATVKSKTRLTLTTYNWTLRTLLKKLW